jgi:hypothetical protein
MEEGENGVDDFNKGGMKMSTQYKTGIGIGILLGILIYFLTIWLLPVLGKLTWVFT